MLAQRKTLFLPLLLSFVLTRIQSFLRCKFRRLPEGRRSPLDSPCGPLSGSDTQCGCKCHGCKSSLLTHTFSQGVSPSNSSTPPRLRMSGAEFPNQGNLLVPCRLPEMGAKQGAPKYGANLLGKRREYLFLARLRCEGAIQPALLITDACRSPAEWGTSELSWPIPAMSRQL